VEGIIGKEKIFSDNCQYRRTIPCHTIPATGKIDHQRLRLADVGVSWHLQTKLSWQQRQRKAKEQGIALTNQC